MFGRVHLAGLGRFTALSFFVLVLLLMFGSGISPANAAEKKGKKFEDTMKVDGVDLKLNAIGIRRVSKFGIPVKVYVGGFYVSKPTKVKEEMLKQPKPVLFRMVFLLSAGKKDIVEGWEKSFNDNCKTDCDKAKSGLKEFTDLVSNVHDDTVSTIKITKDTVEADMQGNEPKKATIKNKAFAENFMRIFFGDDPEDTKLVEGLLGNADL